MRPASLVARLLRATLAAFLAATAAAALLLLVLHHVRDADYLLDAEVEEKLDELELSLDIAANGDLLYRPVSSSDMYDALRKDTAFRVVDVSGRTVLPSLDGPALQALERTPLGTDSLELRDDGERVQLRVGERDVISGSVSYRLQAAHSSRFEARLGEYARELYLGSAITTVVGALLVFFLVILFTVRRALTPLQRASAIAAGIGPRTLGARLNIGDVPSEVAPLIDALNSALERLEQGFRVQQAFLAHAAHELKTPLALLQAEIELGGQNREAMLRETRLMGRQVKQLLHLAEVSEGHNYRFARRSLWALAADGVDYLGRLAERRGVTLQICHDGPEAWVDLDDGAAFVLLKNLLENAVNHSPFGGTVTLHVSRRGLAVTDEGPGVESAHRVHLFARFWRGPVASDGAGLGLAIVREICMAHGWTVHFEPVPHGGARFVVAMPGTTSAERDQ
ncbi:HAMP domain-containing histidine kinase [Luteimonas fraxinea]|uniref:histidine kinase n=1 Tax=Luteimonas fraxinea TaxID=2901869 RepID=A0ABS8U6F9_9GAMM|nr:ATP-binding protein [Luteimonas fraxinea]MCD9095368.1 HAMP domain-containing histidine kinase [Luteimonas fraxinea]UHH11418.1 HAMP domain-containing histidine kinase [Luteimonas fraxinea]